MQLAQDISSIVLSIRKKVNIKVRQPLDRILIPITDTHVQKQILLVEELIKNEVNVKSIQFLSDDDGFIKKKIKADFKALGARMGAKMKAVANAIHEMTQHQIAELERNKTFGLEISGEIVEINLLDVSIIAEDIPGWSVANKDNFTVALDVTVTPELLNEGIAREIVNRIQKIRKENGFELTDRIIVRVEEVDVLKTAITQYNDYICAEILADNIMFAALLDNGTEVDVNDTIIKISISKIA
jgi:isoleucyl-tRNA synthetase